MKNLYLSGFSWRSFAGGEMLTSSPNIEMIYPQYGVVLTYANKTRGQYFDECQSPWMGLRAESLLFSIQLPLMVSAHNQLRLI